MTTRTRTLEDLAGSNVIDSRDLIARLEELADAETRETEARQEYQNACDTWTLNGRQGEPPDLPDTYLDDDEHEELNALRAICDEGESFPDWGYGVTLIRDSYFTEYAQELAEDIGAISHDAQWPLAYIDWDRAANALKMDYSTVEIEGCTYYGRM